jgi:two-component system phosphate regulon sensor histidine kinase PhoR
VLVVILAGLPLGLLPVAGQLLGLPGTEQLVLLLACGGPSILLGWLVYREFSRQITLQTAVVQRLRSALQEEKPRPPRLHEEGEGLFGRWQLEWNETATDVCALVGEMRRAQSALQEQQKLLETVLGTMSEGVLVLDEQKSVLFANGACRQLLDVRLREVRGRPIWEVTRSQAFLNYVQQPLEVGSEFRRTIELVRPQLTLEISISPLPAAPATGLVIVLHDVTELRRLERSRREFFNNVSHELKTPLTSIQCFADTLLDGGLEDKEHNRGMVQQIARQAEKLYGLIQDILRLARIENRYEHFEREPVELAELIRESVEDRSAIAAARQVELTLEEPLAAGTVLGDRTGLQSIIENLLNNAINYNRPRGTVRVSCHKVRDGLQLLVKDSGIGIPREHQERIFERFFRVDKARSAESGGSGLGLAIVKHLVAVFSGRIEVESEVGEGSEFRVWFPLCNTESKVSAESQQDTV